MFSPQIAQTDGSSTDSTIVILSKTPPARLAYLPLIAKQKSNLQLGKQINSKGRKSTKACSKSLNQHEPLFQAEHRSEFDCNQQILRKTDGALIKRKSTNFAEIMCHKLCCSGIARRQNLTPTLGTCGSNDRCTSDLNSRFGIRLQRQIHDLLWRRIVFTHHAATVPSVRGVVVVRRIEDQV